mmetsp:Transcript_18822/g.52131  ORF Transcript_18822/g.52131 Transcript_18822/m.52131 type:complete len:207 (+) Transcript_18822:119-739(+)
MGLGDEHLVDHESVSATLRCSICTEVFVDPVSFPAACQHVFCRLCIRQARHHRDDCPNCRHSLRGSSEQANMIVQSFLDELQTRCGSGCGWTGRQDAKAAHSQSCPLRLLAEARHLLVATRTERDDAMAQRDAMKVELDTVRATMAAEVQEARMQRDNAVQQLQALKCNLPVVPLARALTPAHGACSAVGAAPYVSTYQFLRLHER